MPERTRYIGPIVDIKSSDTGVLMTTTQTTVREEVFVDAQQARQVTRNRIDENILKFLAGSGIAIASAIFALNGAISLFNDIKDKNPEHEVRDAETILLGAAVAFGGLKTAKNAGSEGVLADKQARKVNELPKIPRRTSGIEN